MNKALVTSFRNSLVDIFTNHVIDGQTWKQATGPNGTIPKIAPVEVELDTADNSAVAFIIEENEADAVFGGSSKFRSYLVTVNAVTRTYDAAVVIEQFLSEIPKTRNDMEDLGSVGQEADEGLFSTGRAFTLYESA